MTSLRTTLIVALIGLQALAVGAVLAVTYVASEATLIGHAERLMRRAAADANRFAEGFLRPADDAATLSRRLAESGVLATGEEDRIARYFYEQLRGRPEFAGIYHGEASGDFLYVSRTEDEALPFRTKAIEAAPERRVALTFHEASFAPAAMRFDPEDDFDPRDRPWFAAAVAAGGPAWTDPYVFFSSGRPGITVATPVTAGGGATGVVGIDIEIDALSRFLDTLEPSEWGSVAILSRAGRVVAHRDPLAVQAVGEDGRPRLARLGEVQDAPLRAAVAALPGGLEAVDDASRPLIRYEADGEDWLAVFEPLDGGLTPWIVASYLPESDFTGALDAVRRTALILAAAIALATALIGLRIATLVSRPVEALSAQAESVAAGSLEDTSLPPMRFRELRHMADAMRAATAALRDRRDAERDRAAERERAAEVLEETVAARTSALEAARARAEILTGEIDHRIKNLFATAGILVSAVAREAPSAEEAGRRARARIDALARAHDATTDGTSADLADLLRATLAPYEEMARIEMDGPPVRLGRAAITPVGLIVYELATNAAKYGALGAGGHLDIDWTVRGGTLRLVWRESGAAPAGGASAPGFGTGMMGAMTEQIGATLAREIGEEGAVIEMTLPLGET